MTDPWEGAVAVSDAPLEGAAPSSSGVSFADKAIQSRFNLAANPSPRDYLREFNVAPTNEADRETLNRIIHLESGGKSIVSPTGDSGLFQFNHANATRFAVNAQSPVESQVRAAERRLAELKQETGATSPQLLATGWLSPKAIAGASNSVSMQSSDPWEGAVSVQPTTQNSATQSTVSRVLSGLPELAYNWTFKPFVEAGQVLREGRTPEQAQAFEAMTPEQRALYRESGAAYQSPFTQNVEPVLGPLFNLGLMGALGADPGGFGRVPSGWGAGFFGQRSIGAGQPSAAFVGSSLQGNPLKPLAEGLQKGMAIVDTIKRAFAPASRGPAAETTAGIVREGAARLAADTERAHAALKTAEAAMDRLPREQQLGFIRTFEAGDPQGQTGLQAVARALRTILDQRRTAVQDLGEGQLQNFIENYYPHLWKDPEQARNVMSELYGRRPLGGPESFLKKRTIPTIQEGIDAGLEPVTTNPVTATLLKVREMDRFLMKERIVSEMKQEGLTKFVRFGQRPPEGWIKINDKAFRAIQYSEAEKGFVNRGDYYAPEQAATIINRYLSPGLQGNPVYDLYRGLSNSLNQAQLGISAFHLGFTALDAAVSKVALGIQQLLKGRPIQGLGSIAHGLVPGAAPISSFIKGNKTFREFYAPGSEGAEIAAALDRYLTGGGRMVMDRFYTNSAAEQFWKALRTGHVATAGLKAYPALVEALAKPTMEVIVPRMKAGVAADLTAFELSKLHPNATKAMQRSALGTAVNSVDNRLGQLPYDNLFWNRALKDLGLASVRSLGWNLGTFRELGGGIGDIISQTGKLFRGQRPEVTPRMAYTVALPFVVGLYGGIMNYLYTGETPRELKDYFFPRTGAIRPDGNPARISLPSYMKDIYAYAQHPLTTLGHKVNPVVSTVIDMLKNEDYYGALIRNPDDPLVNQVRDEMAYAAKQYEPFSSRGIRQQLQQGKPLLETLPNLIGVTPAPASISRTVEQNAAIERRQNRQGLRKKQREANTPSLSDLLFKQ